MLYTCIVCKSILITHEFMGLSPRVSRGCVYTSGPMKRLYDKFSRPNNHKPKQIIVALVIILNSCLMNIMTSAKVYSVTIEVIRRDPTPIKGWSLNLVTKYIKMERESQSLWACQIYLSNNLSLPQILKKWKEHIMILFAAFWAHLLTLIWDGITANDLY